MSTYLLDKFKKSMTSYKPDAFRAKLDAVIDEKRKVANDLAIAEAVAQAAKASADATLMGRLFG